jgi:ribosome-binding protein aMBF1 (putative translation factor)
MSHMGAATPPFPFHRPLSDKDREQAVHEALRSGLVRQIRDTMGWSTTDLAERMNVLPSLVEGWERLDHLPSPYAAAKLWTVLVCAVRYERASPHEPPALPLV